MSPEAWIAVSSIVGALLILTGTIWKVGWQRPSKELVELVHELQKELRTAKDDIIRLQTRDEERARQFHWLNQAFDFLAQEVHPEFPTAVKIAREIAAGLTVRNVSKGESGG